MTDLVDVQALHYSAGSSDKVWAYVVLANDTVAEWRAVWGRRTGPKMSKTMRVGTSITQVAEHAAAAYHNKRMDGYQPIGQTWRDPKWGLTTCIDAQTLFPDIVTVNPMPALQSAWLSANRPNHTFIAGIAVQADGDVPYCATCGFIEKGHGRHIAPEASCEFCALSDAYDQGLTSNTNVQCVCTHNWYSGHGVKGTSGTAIDHRHRCLVSKCKCEHFQLAKPGSIARPKKSTTTTVVPPQAATIIAPIPRRAPRAISHLLPDDL